MPDPTRTAGPAADPRLTHSVADPATTTGGAAPSVATPSVPATDGGHYVLGEEIARGGMGVVYRATDTAFGREVAVKVLQERYAPDSGTARRFHDEARITGQLQHPGIPPVFGLGTLPDGRPFLAMKLIKGRTLEDLLAGRPDASHDRGKFVAVFEQACQAVAYAHAHQVIHRDLKPANVMVGSFGEVQVMDWGLAKVLTERPGQVADPEATRGGTEVVSLRDSDGSFTQAGSVLGTPAFMPPEQAVGAVGKVDERSDVFGLGGILAVVLTGQPPFASSSAETIRVKAATGDVADCFARLDGCGADPELVVLCKRCLSPKPADRPADAGVVATAVAELRHAADERARLAELDKVRVEGEKAAAEAKAAEQRKRRRVQLALVAAVGVVVLLAGVGGAVIRAQAAGRRADADAAASAALGRAELLASQGVALDPRTPEEARAAVGVWEQAEAAAAQAEAPAAACTAGVAARVAGKAAEIRDGLARARRDATLLQGLADVRTTPGEQVGGMTDTANGVRVFRSALAAAGLPARLAGAEDVQAAVAAIRAERPGVRAALRSAIDLLLSASPQAGYQADFEFAAWLEAADRCDDTPFRREARGALIQVRIAWLTTSGWPVSRLAPGRAAPPIGLPELIRLAERAEAEDPPVDAVVMLSKAITELTDSQDSDARLRRLLRVARDRHPNDPDLLREFGYNMRTYWNATREPRAFGEALGSFRAWIAVRPDDAQAYYYLGILLGDHGDDAEAAAAYRAALARNPKYNFARINLANALQRLGDLDGSIAVLRETVQLDPRFVMAHNNLGKSLERKGDLDGAVAEYKEALRLEPTNAGVHNSLGWVLQQKGELEGAVAEFKEAVRLDPKYALAHNNLGWVLQQKGDLDGAVSSYREAVRLDPKQQYAVANLPRAERMRALLPRLPGVLAGTDRPATAAEAVGFAELLGEPFQRRYAAAARFFEQAFSADPALADVFTSTGGGHRYDAACYAARAARGEGVDYPPDPAQRAALRAKALAWLRADLAIWKRQAASRSASERTAAAAALTWWLGDSDLSAVRRPFLLAALPAAEAKKWLAFWTDVRSTLAEAQKPAPPPETAPPPRAE